MPIKKRNAKWLVAVLATVSASGLVAACGSSTNTSKQPASHGRAASTLARRYTQIYDQMVGTAPRILGESGAFSVPALTKAPPKNKLLGVINCTAPVCNSYTDGAIAGAKELGWKTTQVTAAFSPQAWVSAWQALLQKKPNVIVFGGLAPTKEILPEIQQARKQGVIVVAYSVDRPAGGTSPIQFETDATAEFVDQGALQAYGAVADSGGAPDVVILTDPTVPAWVPMRARIKNIIASVGGTANVLDVSQAGVGKTVPQDLVTYLQAHPAVKYVLPSFDDFMPGIPEALKAAGITGVKVIGTSASQASVGLVKTGGMYSTVVHMTGDKGYWLIWAAAEIMNGTPPTDANPDGPMAVATQTNAAEFSNVANWPESSVAMFRKALGG